MPAPRLPKAKAELTGAMLTHPGRYRDRKEPHSAESARPLGQPSTFLSGFQVEAWEAYKRELPYLTEGDRSVVEVASVIRGRLFSGVEVGVPQLNTLRVLLGQLGATPTDRSKVFQRDEKRDDPTEEFFDA
jgi:hypothetical protein